MPSTHTAGGPRASWRSLAAALLGFFIITLDALVVSVALPAIREDLGGGITGLQWVVDGYTLPFAALLLLAGSLSDRFGARRAFAVGLWVFVASSAGCAIAPTLSSLVMARVVQGAGAALMTPASLALIGEAYPEPAAKARAIGTWAVGGAVASASGPLIGGALTGYGWPLIFLVNIPVGVVSFVLLQGVPASRQRPSRFDVPGQVLAMVGLTALTYGLIEVGGRGLELDVLVALGIAIACGPAFLIRQVRGEEPMVPLHLFRRRTPATTIATGFSFMAGFFGMVFLISLYLQEERGLSPLETGIAFVPVTAFSIVMPVLAARVAERFGAWVPVLTGQLSMAVGLFALALFAEGATVTAVVAMMVPVGAGGGFAMPSATSLLLNTVPAEFSGTASGVLNTSRQVGGAVAIAAFGGFVAQLGFDTGLSVGLGSSAVLLTLTGLASLRLDASPSSAPAPVASPCANA